MLKERYASNRACVSKAGLFAPCMAGAVLVVVSVLLSASNAVAQSTTVEFDIPAQPISSALRAYAHQAKVQLLVLTEGLDTIQANAVVGHLDRRAALQMLLAGTGLQAEYRPDDTVAVRRGSDAAGPVTSEGGDARHGQASWLAQVRQEAGEGVMTAQATVDQNQTSRSTATDSGKGENKRHLEEIIVTGTNIRGIAPESSPVRTFTREDIQISGAATAQDFIQTLTANFGGGSNTDTGFGLPNDVNSQFNSGTTGSLGSSVNLRGLGSGSTLVLLNGHRLAPSSGIGDFADISMIPVSAVARIEVLTDGASSIYGADAVSGVVNFVTREHFEGAEASFRYGTVTDGDLNQYRASVTGGESWNTGNALFVYEYFKQGSLSAADRSFSQGAVMPFDLLPSTESHSALVSAAQEVGANLKVFADVLYSTRESKRDRTDLLGEFRRVAPSSRSLNLAGGATWNVSGTWSLDIGGTFSDLRSEPVQLGALGRVQSSKKIDSRIWAADAIASGSVFHVSGGDVKLAIGGHFRSEDFENFDIEQSEIDRQAGRDVYAFFGEAFIPIVGPDNKVPGVNRLELNVSGRFEDFSDFGSTANPKVGLLWSPVHSLSLRASYSTSFNPPPLGRVGATDTTVTALRTSLLNSIFGLTPGDPSIADVVVLSVFGTGDELDAETSRAITVGLDFVRERERHNLLLKTTWFNVEFENRLGQTPIPAGRTPFDAPNIAFNSPEAFPEGTVVFSPSQSQINQLLDNTDTLVALEDPLNAEIINFAHVVRNLSRTSVSGFDFEVAYNYESDPGTVVLGLVGTYLADFKQQGANTTPIVEQIDTLYNPVDLSLRGRAGFSRDRLAADIFLNYSDDYRVDNSAAAVSIDSWTTVDISLSYDTGRESKNSILNNSTLRLSVLNLFDTAPPETPSNPQFRIFGFDPTNASPLNRFIAFDLTKRF